MLRNADTSQVAQLLQEEHPQTIALVLSYLEAKIAADILTQMPPELQVEVVLRLARMDRVSPQVVQVVEGSLKQKLSGVISAADFRATGGVSFLVKMLNQVDRGTEKIIIEALEEEDPELAEEIKKRMFVFEDIVLLDDRSIQKVLREVDTQDLAKALKGVDTEVQEKIFRNMSKRASSLLREDMDFMGPIRLRDVEEAQQKIVNIIRKLEEAGDIIVARAGEEELVV
jgi:flagellar motor switch protein FliG